MKKATIWIAGVGIALAAGGAAQAQGSASLVPVMVNGGRLDRPGLLLRDVNRTVVPMRALFEALGANVRWDASQRAVYAWTPDGNGIRLGVGERSAQTLLMDTDPGPGAWGRVTGQYRLDAPAMLREGTVYVPLRFASEALKADVRFAAHEPAVYVRSQLVAGYREGDLIDGELPARPDERLDRREARRERREDRRSTELELERSRQRELELERELEAERNREVVPPVDLQAREIAENLELKLELPARRLDLDQKSVPIRLVVRNTGRQPLTVPFRSGQRFNIEVLQEGKLVWSWAHDRAFTQALTEMTLEPGQAQVFPVRWSLADNRGEVVQPGRYTVRGILTTSFREPQLVVEERINVR
ncbi:MAG: BsuPI-related putative proteinase inhibitor [Armatimonadota bacterium]